MARPIIVNFPAVNDAAFLNAQDGEATNSIVLAFSPESVLRGTSRLITLTSGDDLSGVNFTITGRAFDGTPLTEVIVGPNANTVTSVNEFSDIFYISPDDAYTDLSIGIGLGSLLWIPMNYQITPFQYSIQVTVTGAITYSLIQTLSPLSYYNTLPSISELVVTEPDDIAIVAGLTNATTNQFYSSQVSCVAIGGAVSAGTGSLQIIILQAGV